MLLFLIAGISLAILAGIYLNVQIYQMVKIDAFYRGMNHPKLWAFFAGAGPGWTLALRFLSGPHGLCQSGGD